MHSLEEIEKVKTAHNIIIDDLEFNGEYDIDIIREKISILKTFLEDKKIVNKTYLQYIKFLELVYFYFEYDTLQNRKFIIVLSKNIDSAINSAISNSTKPSRTFSHMDTADTTLLKSEKEMLQNVCNFTTIEPNKKITKL